VVQLFNVIKKHQAIHGVSEDAVENGTQTAAGSFSFSCCCFFLPVIV